MELLHIHKDTWAAVGATALIPFYRLTDTDIVLLDTGIAASDREGLTALLEEHGLHPKGILCSHAHYDHVGNAAYLRCRYGCPIAMPMIEAAICADATAFRANYETLTYGTIQSMFPEECFLSDVLISPDIDHLDFCGVRFGLLPLPQIPETLRRAARRYSLAAHPARRRGGRQFRRTLLAPLRRRQTIERTRRSSCSASSCPPSCTLPVICR